MVAEQRALPAAEGMEGHRHWYRHIDPDHPGLDLGQEGACRVAIAGEDGGAVAELMAVHQIERRVEAVRPHHRQHRAEYLFLIDAHVGRYPVEQRAAEEETVLI